MSVLELAVLGLAFVALESVPWPKGAFYLPSLASRTTRWTEGSRISHGKSACLSQGGTGHRMQLQCDSKTAAAEAANTLST